jgi:Arc/MetJ-type ribon-helix-helix transcriptional regulator
MKRAKPAVSLPAEVAAGAKAAVAAGRSPSVSALVGEALAEKLRSSPANRGCEPW